MISPARIALPFLALGALSGCDRLTRQAPAPALAAAIHEAAAQGVAAAPAEALPETITFNEHIQPILSEYCYHCHGPDSGTRKPESEPLRLDRAEDAFAVRADGQPAIVKGDPAASSVMRLIHSDNPNEVMPPPSSHKTLEQREIALLERWIREGAEYQEHWSFIPPQRPATPDTGKDWSSNPVDSFIAAGLAAAGLQPNPEEAPGRFYRRLHLDLTGLPPSPEAVAAFEQAAAANYQQAVARAADELLATPAAAEHEARIWLDAARYADTHGIHIDNYRAIWPYRDWVVRAFAENMPWDQFTIEQIAGDLLPEPTRDQVVATGFSRCLPTTGEGGAIPAEYEAIYAKDRVDTVSAVWLGLTIGCASCHDSKFDPISMKDYYSFAAFFQNTTMNAMDGNNAEHPPNIFVPAAADRARWDALPKELENHKAALAARNKDARQDFEQWLATAPAPESASLAEGLALHLPLTEADGPIHGTADGQPREWAAAFKRRDGSDGKAILAHTSQLELGDLAGFGRGDQVSFGLSIYVEGAPHGAVVARMDPAQAFRGWDLWLEQGRIGSHIIDQWPATASKIVAPEPLTPGRWHHVMVVFDGTRPAAETMTLFVNGQAVKPQVQAAAVGDNITAAVPLRIGSRGGDDSTVKGVVAIQDFRFYQRALTPAEVELLGSGSAGLLAIPADQRTPEQTERLYQHYLAHADGPSREFSAKIAAATAEQQSIRGRGSVSLIMQERPGSEPATHILERGAYSSPGERVTADVPASLPALPADAPRNRLGLARWLVSRDNPLTARVTVNRLWQRFFGLGMVESEADFGIMGARPVHPALLDWLAVEFMESGWDARHIAKLVVTSAAYRQSAVVTPEKLERDPANRLISRGPRLRLDGEVLRDMALAVSGLLVPDIGGPPVKPYQPEGIWEAVAMKESNTRFYKQDSGAALYRRSLYTFWKRTAPPPSMEILNAPSREVVCTRRDATNTPLQALVTLNDPQFVEASRQLAAAAIQAGSEPSARLDHITRRLLGRTLADAERAVVMQSHERVRGAFTADPEAAKALLAVGATLADDTIPAEDLAAWTLTASQILNLDEALTR